MHATDSLTTMFSHHLWANLRLLELCAGLTDAQLDAAIVGGFGSIRDTLEHIVKAEQSYFSRVSTGQRLNRPEHEPPMSIAEMIDSARATGAGFVTWAPRVQAGDSVPIDWDGTIHEVPKAVILTQVINHATEHRAQVMAILTQLGLEPPELSGWEYFAAQSGF